MRNWELVAIVAAWGGGLLLLMLLTGFLVSQMTTSEAAGRPIRHDMGGGIVCFTHAGGISCVK